MRQLKKKIFMICLAVCMGVPSASLHASQIAEPRESGSDSQIQHKPGWNFQNNIWYYFDEDGVMKTGWQRIGGKWYYFDRDGAMNTGWKQIEKKWYFMESNGVMKIGWKHQNGIWYYFDGNGVMKTGWQRIAGKWYYFNDDGAMKTGWKQIGEKWYLLDRNGVMKTGWQHQNGIWFYLDVNGVMKTGWQRIRYKWYFFNSDGAMKTGWQKIDQEWYYLGGDGAMRTGWQFIGGVWYYLKGAVNDPVKTGWQNPEHYYQVSSKTVKLPSYCTGYFTYVSPSVIATDASRQACINAFINRAYEYLGTPYKWGYSCAPGVGIDCSGLVMQSLYATGMDTAFNPYIHPDQEDTTGKMLNDKRFKQVSLQERQRGDLIFYPGHVAIYLGNDQVINARGGRGVIIESMWIKEISGVIRPFI